MSILTVVKHYDELTPNELYRIIQLRIQGFIVRNKVCYQDLEAHYDKNSYWCMNYDTVLGLEPQNMVGTIGIKYLLLLPRLPQIKKSYGNR